MFRLILERAECQETITIIVFVVHGTPCVSTHFLKYSTSSGMITFNFVFMSFSFVALLQRYAIEHAIRVARDDSSKAIDLLSDLLYLFAVGLNASSAFLSYFFLHI